VTVFKSTDGLVVGQPISPFFGAQNGQQGAGAPVIQSPAVAPNSGVQIPMGDSQARGSLPRNAYVTSVNGTNVGIGDVCSVAELAGSGNGYPSMAGSPPAPSGAVQDQQFTAGLGAVAMQENGPTTTNNEPLPFAPVSQGTLVSNLSVTANGFAG
jgi:hypothetical protein